MAAVRGPGAARVVQSGSTPTSTHADPGSTPPQGFFSDMLATSLSQQVSQVRCRSQRTYVTRADSTPWCHTCIPTIQRSQLLQRLTVGLKAAVRRQEECVEEVMQTTMHLLSSHTDPDPPTHLTCSPTTCSTTSLSQQVSQERRHSRTTVTRADSHPCATHSNTL